MEPPQKLSLQWRLRDHQMVLPPLQHLVVATGPPLVVTLAEVVHIVTDLVLKWSSETIAWIAGHTKVPGPPPSTLGTCPHSFSSRNAYYLSLVWCHRENKKHQDADRNFEKHHN